MMLYPRLALTGIKKNRQTYTPYILTCSGMIMMYYIVSFLSRSEQMKSLEGGSTMAYLLNMGCGIMIAFSAIFLYYTNSFLIKRRTKEFGLYNILGMGKRNISKIMIWETLMIYAAGIVIGCGCGILFSKLAELFLKRIMLAETDFSFHVDLVSVWHAMAWFGIIFILILINSLHRLRLSDPLELLHSENTGEKPPRSNWLLAVIGAVLLGFSYYLAVVIQDPLSAVLIFFFAVIMVIIATYLLFIAGSVVFCKALRSNKNYYYKTNHFVSVSQMIYRMKRNGAGLASICILSTMVLVTMSTTICLYAGEENIVDHLFSRDVTVTVNSTDKDIISEAKDIVSNAAASENVTLQNEFTYRYAEFSALADQNTITLSDPMLGSGENIYDIYFVPIEDYNSITGSDVFLKKNQMIIYSEYFDTDITSLIFKDIREFQIIGKAGEFTEVGGASASVLPTMYVFTDSIDTIREIRDIYYQQSESYMNINIKTYCGYDLDCSDSVKKTLSEKMLADLTAFTKAHADEENYGGLNFESREINRIDFYSTYGGLFFLGILLGSVFVVAAVLIMYYKQVSEGYEDRSRFDILRKVGMSRKEIRQSINSQVLTVFFLPLAAAGVHMIFAFPIISRMLRVFGMNDSSLFAVVTLISFGIFALFYTAAYFITSRSYYKIAAMGDMLL